MKKTFNRLLAATVAIPVALGQLAAISATAAETEKFAVTTEKLLNVETNAGFPTDAEGDTITFTQVSNWNETVAKALEKADGKVITVDAKAIVSTLGSGYYASLIKDIVNASADPTATVSGSTVTIAGTADFSSYIVPELEEKFAELGYGEIKLNTAAMTGEYKAVVTADLDNKKASATLEYVSGGKTYTVDTAVDYLTAIYDDLSAQVDAIVAEKAGQDVETDKAELKAITDKMANKVTALQNKLDLFKTANISERTYDTANATLAAALNYAVKNGIASAANQPNTVDGMVAKYGATFDNAVASLNSSLEAADVNVEIQVSSADIASVLNGASNFVVSAAKGAYSADFDIEDAEYDAVVAYVEAQVEEVYGGTKEVESVETVKTVEVDANVEGTVALDVVRDVTVVLKDKDTTDTTTNTDDTTGTDSSETTTNTDDTTGTDSSETTTNTDDTTGTDSSETTASTDDTTGTGSSDTTASTDDTTGTGSSETTASTDDTTDTTETSDSTGTTETLPTDIEAISVKMLDESASNGVYFSHEESFDAADLIESVVVTLSDGSTQELDPATAIGFVSTPGEVYATVDQEAGKGKVYFKGEVEIYYAADPEKTPLEDKPVVAVAKKGDVNLSGFVDADDAYEMLVYYAAASVAKDDVAFKTVGNEDALLAKLAYYVADIDTESKLGKDDEDRENPANIIDADDAYKTLVYYAQYSLNKNPNWADIMKGATAED